VICYCLVPEEDYSTEVPTYIIAEMYNTLYFSTLLDLALAHIYEKSSNSLAFVPFFSKEY